MRFMVFDVHNAMQRLEVILPGGFWRSLLVVVFGQPIF